MFITENVKRMKSRENEVLNFYVFSFNNLVDLFKF